MTDRAGPTTAPLILLAVHIHEEVMRRSLESVLLQGGYRVVLATDSNQALALVHAGGLAGVVLDTSLAEPPHFEFCRTVRSDPALSTATPIILTSAGHVTRTQQVDALRAGAWDLRGDPIDTEDLLLRLDAYVRATMEVERARAAGMIDRASGLYNAAGVQKRSEELAALCTRQGLPLSCVVFRATTAEDRVAQAFKQEGRMSDAIGRTGFQEFAVFAMGTDRDGAARLAARLGQAVAKRAGLQQQLVSGISSSTGAAKLDPQDLLARARHAVAP